MFDHLSPHSKVWIYTANREFSSEDEAIIADAMKRFLPQWAAHGNALFGDYSLEYQRFLILVVDESQAGASGCSIDTSVRFIKDLGTRLNIDFFNRLAYSPFGAFRLACIPFGAFPLLSSGSGF